MYYWYDVWDSKQRIEATHTSKLYENYSEFRKERTMNEKNLKIEQTIKLLENFQIECKKMFVFFTELF